MLDFSSFVQNARKNSPCELPTRILCLDPGETTGWCTFLGSKLNTWGQIKTVQNGEPYWDAIEDLLTHECKNIGCDAIVCENYRIYQTKLERHSFSKVPTIRVIGGIQYMAWKFNVPVVFQMATQAKGFATDDKLKAWGFYQEGMKHSRDAIRHGIYALLFAKWDDILK